MKILKKTIGYPAAESTPNISNTKNQLKFSPETSHHTTPISSVARRSSNENKSKTISSSCENLAQSEKLDLKKSQSHDELTFDKKRKQKLAKLGISRAVCVECSGTSLKSSSKYIQTSVQRQISRSVQTEFPYVPSPKSYKSATNSPVPEPVNIQSVIYVQHVSDGNVTSSASTQTGSEGNVSKCNSFEYLYGDLYVGNAQKQIVPPLNLPNSSQSDEPISPENAQNYMKDSNFTIVTSASTSTTGKTNSVQSSSDYALGALLEIQLSKRLITDVEKSLELMQKLIQSQKYDSATKKHFIKKLVRKIVNSNYIDDSTEVETTPSVPEAQKSSLGSKTNTDHEEKDVVEDEVKKSLLVNKPWVPPTIDAFKQPRIQKPPRKFQIKTFCSEIIPPVLDHNNSDALVPTLTKNKGEIAEKVKVGDVSYVPTKIIYERRLKNSKFTLTNNFFGSEFQERNLNPRSTSTEHTTSNELYDLPKKFTLPPKRHPGSLSSTVTTDGSTGHEKIVKSWRDYKTKSEKIFETKKDDRSDGDQILNYAKKERENQLSWIRNEITHLSKLKKLLENKESAKHKALVKTLAGLQFDDYPQEPTTVYMMPSQKATDSDNNRRMCPFAQTSDKCKRCHCAKCTENVPKVTRYGPTFSEQVQIYDAHKLSEEPLFSGNVNYCDAVKLSGITVELNPDSRESVDASKCICKTRSSVTCSTQCHSQIKATVSRKSQFVPPCVCAKNTQSVPFVITRNVQHAPEQDVKNTQYEPIGTTSTHSQFMPISGAENVTQYGPPQIPSTSKQSQYVPLVTEDRAETNRSSFSRKSSNDQPPPSTNSASLSKDKGPASNVTPIDSGRSELGQRKPGDAYESSKSSYENVSKRQTSKDFGSQHDPNTANLRSRRDSQDIGIQSNLEIRTGLKDTLDSRDSDRLKGSRRSSKDAAIQSGSSYDKSSARRQGSKDFGMQSSLDVQGGETGRRSSKDAGTLTLHSLPEEPKQYDSSKSSNLREGSIPAKTSLTERSDDTTTKNRSNIPSRTASDFQTIPSDNFLTSDASKATPKPVEGLGKEKHGKSDQCKTGKCDDSGKREVRNQGTKTDFKDNKTSQTEYKETIQKSGEESTRPSDTSSSKYSTSSSSSGQVYDLKDVISLLCKCCNKPIKETSKPPVLRIVRERDEDGEQDNFILCHPCYQNYQTPNWSQNYNLPNHVCNCHVGVHKHTLNEIKNCVNDLNALENRPCMSCKNPNRKFWLNANTMMCSKCMCKRKLKRPKSVAYMLTFEEGTGEVDDSDSDVVIPKELAEVKVKIPFRPNKKRNKNIENAKRASKSKRRSRSLSEDRSNASDSKENRQGKRGTSKRMAKKHGNRSEGESSDNEHAGKKKIEKERKTKKKTPSLQVTNLVSSSINIYLEVLYKSPRL